MDSMPFAFIDKVCHQLTAAMLERVADLRTPWSPVGALHNKNREELVFRMCAMENDDEIRNSIISDYMFSHPSCKYIRYTAISFVSSNSPEPPKYVGTSDQVISRLRKIFFLTSNCKFLGAHQEHNNDHPVQREFYRLFAACPAFKSIEIHEQTDECHEFVERQLQHGNLEYLDFLPFHGLKGARNPATWPERFNPLLKSVVQSTRLRVLQLGGTNLHIDFELASLYMERWRSNTLTKESRLSGILSFPESEISRFHPNHPVVTACWGYYVQLDEDTKIRLVRGDGDEVSFISILYKARWNW